MGVLVNDLSLEAVESWFSAAGGTDFGYLRTHYRRFSGTHRFARGSVAQGGVVLDIGCHWLHQALFFANDGDHLICADANNTLRQDRVKRAADRMGATLIPYVRLDKAEGLTALPTESVDTVLFCEIIEHLAFNPIPMWKEIYRVVKSDGHIIVTTPNSLYHERLRQKLSSLFSAAEYGINVDEIMSIGTYGHHWKEFSISELQRYFGLLSSDFVFNRVEATTYELSESEERARLATAVDERIDLCFLAKWANNPSIQSLGQQISVDISIPSKRAGITISPPWLVD